MRYITIALAKGRLAKKAMEIFEQIGIPCEEMKDEKTRKLILTNEELGFRFFLSKPADVPTYVEYGTADIGIVGQVNQLVQRNGSDAVILLDFQKSIHPFFLLLCQ